jgi:CheY-like chemotaxis protein
MTNETQEQTQNRGRLLVIDDNPKYVLNAIRSAKGRGYEVDVAFDLKDAMSYLQSGSYAGVITDLQFYEEGVGKTKTIKDIEKGLKLSHETALSDLERSLLEPIQTKAEIKTNPELRGEIASELINESNLSEMQKLYCMDKWKFMSYSTKASGKEFLERELRERPVMGYEVIKYAQEHNIPFAVVTSVDHGQHCIPSLIQAGITDATTITANNVARKSKIDEVKIECDKNEVEWSDPGFEEWEKQTKEKLQIFDSILLDKTILVMEQSKEQHTYDFAIDMLEGRIDETKPYKIEA